MADVINTTDTPQIIPSLGVTVEPGETLKVPAALARELRARWASPSDPDVEPETPADETPEES